MAGTFNSGPSIVAGPLFGAGAGQTPQEYSYEFGPSITYQGNVIPDVRFPMNKDNPSAGSIPAHFDSSYFLMADVVPAASNTAITVAGNATSGTAFPLIAASVAGVTLNVPLYPFGSNTLVTNAACLDFGFGLIGTTASSTTATPAAGTINLYYPGQWLCIGNVGNAGGTVPLFAQVLSVGATTITLSTPALATNASAPVGSGNVFSITGGTPNATAHTPYIAAGLARILDPQQALMRAVGVTGSASATGGNVTIVGYDCYGQRQTEVIAAPASATTVWGKKTFKWIVSATPAFTDAHNYTVVTSDTFGFTVRADRWEYTNLFWNGAFQSSATGTGGWWLAADTTNPATTTTGDVRGTLQVSTRGAQAGVTSTNFSNGTIRLAMFVSIPVFNLTSATPNNPAPMYGVVPV